MTEPTRDDRLNVLRDVLTILDRNRDLDLPYGMAREASICVQTTAELRRWAHLLGTLGYDLRHAGTIANGAYHRFAVMAGFAEPWEALRLIAPAGEVEMGWSEPAEHELRTDVLALLSEEGA